MGFKEIYFVKFYFSKYFMKCFPFRNNPVWFHFHILIFYDKIPLF